VREVGIPTSADQNPVNIIFLQKKREVRLKPSHGERVNNVLKTGGNGQTPELVDKIYLRTLFRIR